MSKAIIIILILFAISQQVLIFKYSSLVDLQDVQIDKVILECYGVEFRYNGK